MTVENRSQNLVVYFSLVLTRDREWKYMDDHCLNALPLRIPILKPSSKMPKTRGGTDINWTSKDRGRKARKESTKQRKKQKPNGLRRSQRGVSVSSASDSDDDEKKPAAIEKRSVASTRSVPITCRTYGPLRKTMYPGFFFCAHCEFADKHMSPGMMKASAKEGGRRGKCDAKHTNPLFPTHVLSTWSKSLRQGLCLVVSDLPEEDNSDAEDESDLTFCLLEEIEDDEDKEDEYQID